MPRAVALHIEMQARRFTRGELPGLPEELGTVLKRSAIAASELEPDHHPAELAGFSLERRADEGGVAVDSNRSQATTGDPGISHPHHGSPALWAVPKSHEVRIGSGSGTP